MTEVQKFKSQFFIVLKAIFRQFEDEVLAATISRLRNLPLLLLPCEKLDIIVHIFDDIRVLIKILVQTNIVPMSLVKDFLYPDIQGGEKGLWFCHFYATYKSLSKA